MKHLANRVVQYEVVAIDEERMVAGHNVSKTVWNSLDEVTKTVKSVVDG